MVEKNILIQIIIFDLEAKYKKSEKKLEKVALFKMINKLTHKLEEP